MRTAIKALLAFLCAAVAMAWADVNVNTTGQLSLVSANPTISSPVLTGNVGIGTTTAQSALAALGNVGIGTWTAASGNLILNGGGNVGIGTARPGTALDVAGSVRASAFLGNGSGLSNLNYNIGGGLNAVQYNSGSGTSGNEAVFSFNGTNVGMGTTEGRGSLDVRGKAAFANRVGIGTTFLSSNGLTVFGGGVGLGTFAVISNGMGIMGRSPAITLVDAGSNSGDVAEANSTADFVTYSKIGDVIFRSNSGRLVLTQTGGTIPFIELGSVTTRYIRLNPATGNLGIGTIDPLSQLVVAGNGIGIGTGRNSNVVTTTAPLGGLLVEGNVGFGTARPQTSLAILGNVGIGTWTAEGAALAVKGNVGVGTVLPAAPFEFVGIGTTASTMGLIIRDANRNLKYWISNEGYAGHGIAASASAIVWQMQSSVGDNLTRFTNATTGYAAGGIMGQTSAIGGGADLNLINETATGSLYLGGNNTNLMVIDANGNVGIGTMVPQARLSLSSTMNVFGPAPALSGCGTGPSVVGTDVAFRITGGTGAVGCTVTFAFTYNKTPGCVVSPEYATSTASYTVSTTALTFTDAALGTNKVDVICMGFD